MLHVGQTLIDNRNWKFHVFLMLIHLRRAAFIFKTSEYFRFPHCNRLARRHLLIAPGLGITVDRATKSSAAVEIINEYLHQFEIH